MAERNFNVSVIVGFIDKASAELQKFNKSIQDQKADLHAAGLTAVAFGGAIVASLGLAAKAAGQQELEIKKLEHAVNLSGNSWADAEPKLNSWINSMQAMTKYGDGETRPMLQQMLIYTTDLDKAMGASKIAMDMAASGLFDVNTAARYVGMAMSGNVEILGRYIPELKSSTNEALKNMSASEKAEYALGLLQKKFGGMAAVELQTLPGLVKQLSNYFGDLTEDIGDKLLPMLKDFTKQATAVIQGLREWIAEHPVLTKYLVLVTGALGGLLLAFGTLILSLPTIVSGFTSLVKIMPLVTKAFTALALSPGFIAIAALAVAIAYAVKKFYEMKQAVDDQSKAYDELAMAQKTVQEKMAIGFEISKKYADIDINGIKDRKKAYEELTAGIQGLYAAQSVVGEAEKKNINVRINGLKKLRDNLGYVSAEMVAINAKQIAETAATRLADLKKAEVDYANYLSYCADRANEAADMNKQREEEMQAVREEMQYSMISGFQYAMDEMANSHINFATHFTEMMNNITNSTSQAFAGMILSIGTGWSNFAEGFKKILEGIKMAVVNMLANMAAEWLVKHQLMAGITAAWKAAEIAAAWAIQAAKSAANWAWVAVVKAANAVASAATLIWKGIEIAAAAAVGAAKAAAATAWTLWGAIAIGAAIGLGILAMANTFAGGGIVGGNSPTGDKILAGVNTGEMILNKQQQANLFDMINQGGGGGGREINIYVSGNYILNDRAAEDFADMVKDRIFESVTDERRV